MKTTQLAMLLSSGWHPRRLFRGSEMGAVINPSNLPSIYRESTGATAGASGSLVGLILDERYLLAREGEITPALEAANWSVTGTDATHVVTWSNGTMRYQSDTATPALTVTRASLLTVGETYEISCTVSAYTSGSIKTSSFASELNLGAQAGTVRYISAATSADFAMLRNDVNVDLTVSSLSIREVPGSHSTQTTADNRPTLVAGGKIDYDGVNDSLVVTFPSDMGADCTVGRSVPQGEATILTGQTITTTYTDSTDHCGLVIINRALTATETTQLRRWLNRRAG